MAFLGLVGAEEQRLAACEWYRRVLLLRGAPADLDRVLAQVAQLERAFRQTPDLGLLAREVLVRLVLLGRRERTAEPGPGIGWGRVKVTGFWRKTVKVPLGAEIP